MARKKETLADLSDNMRTAVIFCAGLFAPQEFAA